MNYLKLINQFKLLFFKKKDKILSALTKQERYNIYLLIKQDLIDKYFKYEKSSFCFSLDKTLRDLKYEHNHENYQLIYFPELMWHQPLNYRSGFWFNCRGKEEYNQRLKIINQIISDYEKIN